MFHTQRWTATFNCNRDEQCWQLPRIVPVLDIFVTGNNEPCPGCRMGLPRSLLNFVKRTLP